MNVTFDFAGKNFAVIGATSGIGRQVALELVGGGANVLVVGRNLERLDALKKINPQKIFNAALDVTTVTADDWAKIFDEFKNIFGKIDGGVYSAGIVGQTPLNSFDKNLAHKIFDTSFWGAVDFMQIAARKKFSNGGASFVLMSSIAADYGGKSLFAYAAAKAAVKGVVVPLAKEIIRNGHRINSVAPALIQTEMATSHAETASDEIAPRHLLGVGKPADVSGLILFLLSDRANLITGQNFLVDGGYLIGSVI